MRGWSYPPFVIKTIITYSQKVTNIMGKKRDVFSIAVFEILAVIKERPDIMKTDVYPHLSTASKETARLIIDDLVDEQLLVEKKHGLYQKKTYTLSPYGSRVVEAMSHLQDVIDKKNSDAESISDKAAP